MGRRHLWTWDTPVRVLAAVLGSLAVSVILFSGQIPAHAVARQTPQASRVPGSVQRRDRAPRDCPDLACGTSVGRCLRSRGYRVLTRSGLGLAPRSVPDSRANLEALEQLDYAHTPDGENSDPFGLSKPGVLASAALYEGIEGARAAARPTRGATVRPTSRGNIAYVAWYGHPGRDIAACAKH
jgi:hypothetical protein